MVAETSPAPARRPEPLLLDVLPRPPKPDRSDLVHRPFLLGAIATILTVGASWGVIILWRIGLSERFDGVSVYEINAHGHAQVTGWVGLFVMGIAYKVFPRNWRTSLVAPRLAVAVFATTATGLSLATLGLAVPDTAAGVPLAMLGGLLELAAVMVFAGQMLVTYRRSGAPLTPFTGFVMAALFWFVAQSAMGLWHGWTTMTADNDDDLLWYVATYQAPLRDLQIHGLALTMLLGVSQHLLPGLYGVARVPARKAWQALALLVSAIVIEVVLFVAYRWADQHWFAAFLMIPWIMLAVAVVKVARPWRLWRALPADDGRTGIFVRAAYGWLAVSLAMLLLLPVYLAAVGLDFSHAYYGAIRHAITVGFVSLMIMGISSRVVPQFHGTDPADLPSLKVPFVLVNIGCFLRVSLQTLTDVHPFFYAVVGISSLLEVTGITWWAVGLTRVMRRAPEVSPALA